MKKLILLATLILSSLSQPVSATTVPFMLDTTGAKQLLVVKTKDWNSPQGQLFRYKLKDGNYEQVGNAIPIVVGKNGLGWGIGQHPRGGQGPSKKEGDGKAPAGVFKLNHAMGYATNAPDGTVWPYRTATPTLVCVDDSSAPPYNKIVDKKDYAANTPWNSSEKMLRKDHLYKWLVVVDHNINPARPQQGSCIFLHVWRAPQRPTVGCTAMDETHLVEIIKWLKPTDNPVLVQLPQSQYQALKETWKLP